MFRGGGGRGGAKATERKRLESRDEKLLRSMQELLQSFRDDTESACQGWKGRT